MFTLVEGGVYKTRKINVFAAFSPVIAMLSRNFRKDLLRRVVQPGALLDITAFIYTAWKCVTVEVLKLAHGSGEGGQKLEA